MDTISELRKFNRWRRGLNAWHEDVQPNPQEVGRHIDAACDELERLRGEIVELRNVVELLAAPLAIDGPNHAADVKRARSLLSASRSHNKHQPRMGIDMAQDNETLERLRGEIPVFIGLLVDCAAVIRTIEGENSDECEALAELIEKVDKAMVDFFDLS